MAGEQGIGKSHTGHDSCWSQLLAVSVLCPQLVGKHADVHLSMLAVMTMNVGYFMSVLGGVFLGSFVLGGRTSAVAH